MAVSTGGNPIKILESPGKMELVGIADLPADLAHRKICDLEKFGSFFHTVLDKKFLWRLSEDITENLAKITPIQIAAASHVLDRDRTGIILGDEGHSFVRKTRGLPCGHNHTVYWVKPNSSRVCCCHGW